MSNELITINKLELASELAHERLIDLHNHRIPIYADALAPILTYTDEAQDIFNVYYDEYLTQIESCEA